MKQIGQIKRLLAQGELDAPLARLYGAAVERQRTRMRQLLEGYQSVFHRQDEDVVSVFSAPGRTELGGNHTDHQGGKVLTGSVDLDMLACVGENGTDTIRLYSQGYGMSSISCKALAPVECEKNRTAALVRGVLAGFAARGWRISGFDAYIVSDVPGGSGLSSSACFEVLLGVIANERFCGGALQAVELAKIGQYAENVYFGKPSGLLDQMGCAIGGVAAIDFADPAQPQYRRIDLDLASAGYVMCMVDTGADHAGLTADYAAVPEEMRAVAAALGKDVLSQVEAPVFFDALPQLRARVGDRAVLRALHYFNECDRVERQVLALERGDFDAFLQLVAASGQSSFQYLQNVSTFRAPQKQPVAVALAVAGQLLRGRGAARVHGGGFAGAIQAYVPLDLLPAFQQGMEALLGAGACRVTSIRPVGGCAVIA